MSYVSYYTWVISYFKDVGIIRAAVYQMKNLKMLRNYGTTGKKRKPTWNQLVILWSSGDVIGNVFLVK